MPEPIPEIDVVEDAGMLRLIARGDWSCTSIGKIDPTMREIEEISAKTVEIDTSAVSRLDTSGAWLVRRLKEACEDRDIEFAFSSTNSRHRILFEAIDLRPVAPVEVESTSATLGFLDKIGHGVNGLGNDALLWFNVIGASIRGPQMKAGRSGGIRFTSIISHIDQMGLQAIPIVVLMSFLIGIIIAQQSIVLLRFFGAEIFVVDLVSILLLREIGVLLTAIMVAGRTGSAIAAEIGSMKMREEVDALKVIGLNPIGVLVFPRIVALIIAMPLLVVIADFAALTGAVFISWLYVGISPELFITKLRTAIDLSTIISGLSKAPFMALIIAVVSAVEGFKVEGSAESLGKRTTSAVVKSIFFVIVVDGIFAMFYGAIDY